MNVKLITNISETEIINKTEVIDSKKLFDPKKVVESSLLEGWKHNQIQIWVLICGDLVKIIWEDGRTAQAVIEWPVLTSPTKRNETVVWTSTAMSALND